MATNASRAWRVLYWLVINWNPQAQNVTGLGQKVNSCSSGLQCEGCGSWEKREMAEVCAIWGA